MYEVIAQELIDSSSERRFIGERSRCRYCGETDTSAFGKKTNAHAFPAALGNKALFSLDECKSCNARFSIYEDALTKAVGPFLTLGGVKGRSGVRQTGRSKSSTKIRHTIKDSGRHLSVTSVGNARELVSIDANEGLIRLEMPVKGDPFVPRYAHKALLKIALSLLPDDELPQFQNAISCLNTEETAPHEGSLQVGFSYAYVGNAPPALAGYLLRRADTDAPAPYMIFIFMAGSVCFQIWVRSDKADDHVPNIGRLGIQWIAQFPKPEGGFLPIRFSDPIQFDWSEMTPQLQPFKAFELIFNPQTTEAEFIPVER